MGFSQHAGMVIVCDGTPEAAKRIARVLWNDPATGVMRHADAGYEVALDCAREQRARSAGDSGVRALPPRILTPADYRRMPWKNGGGETIEIAVEPAGAGLDDFAWRLSMAKVERDGPFSLFAGIDRTLCLLEGEGMRLAVDGAMPIELTLASPPFSFPGDAAAGAALIAGPIVDLNVMTRRRRLAHRVVVACEPTAVAIDADAAGVLVYCHGGAAVAELRPEKLCCGRARLSMRPPASPASGA